MHHSKPVQDAINYINENLTSLLSLETLAEYAHFSPYYFHRLFLLYMGEAPMEYIRRQRLKSASRDLLSINLNIIEVAAKYRFESQDGFCRAFKRYYGVTPGEYRKLNIKKGHSLTQKPNNPARIKEVHTIMYDMNTYERLVCSHDDKKEALSTLDTILDLSEKVKRSGLLSLEQEIDEVQPDIFKKSIQLVIDGIEPESLREILMNYVLCGGYKGRELLVRILIIEGILAIQQGIHTLILREKLSSFFGEDFIAEIQKYFGIDGESHLKKMESFINKNQEKSSFSKETSLLDEPLVRLDDRSLQRLLRETDAVTLAMAMSGAHGKTKVKILKNISKKLAVMLIDEMETLGTPIISKAADAQKRILEIMHSLKNQGEINI